MNYEEVMSTLKDMGTEQNRKIYARHGASKNMYGVSTANLKKLQKKIKVNHDLALQLWQSNNMDACVLGTMIADPQKLTVMQVKQLTKQVDYYMLCSYVAGLISKTSFFKKLMMEWTKSEKKYYRQSGYNILTCVLKEDHSNLSEEECRKFLKIIEQEIHSSSNGARYAMNNSVIAIGTYKLEKEAIETAKRIGKVDVDHGDTSCKTPDAVTYIKKSVEWLQKKNQNKSTKTSSESARRKKFMGNEVSDAKPKKSTKTKAKATKASKSTKTSLDATIETPAKTTKAKVSKKSTKATETKAKATETKAKAAPKAKTATAKAKAAPKAKTATAKAKAAPKAKTATAKAKATTTKVKVTKAKATTTKAKAAPEATTTKAKVTKAKATTAKAEAAPEATATETQAKAPKAKATKAKASKAKAKKK